MFRAAKELLKHAILRGSWCVLACAFFAAGCRSDETWPPAPRDAKERLMVDMAMRAVSQHDGWTDTAFVVKRSGRDWEVEAWKIVYPEARGRKRCVPWSVRFITLDDYGVVKEYRNKR